jgi:hypothetical protein
MKRLAHFALNSFLILLAFLSSTETSLIAHHSPAGKASQADGKAAANAGAAAANGVTGQGKMKFKVLYTASHLPQEAGKVLVSAHGGFAVDRREGKGETYFALPGAGIIQISGDLKKTRMLTTAENVKKANLHNTTIWYGSDGTGYLVFPANAAGQVFTTALDGTLLHTLEAPSGQEDFGVPMVSDYFAGRGNFAPTDVEQLDGLYYVATGYSNLDYVLAARILSTNPFKASWYDLAFGGKGSGPGQFGTAHGITVVPGTKKLDVSDRPNSEIDRFSRYGQYLSTLRLPMGSFPCDINYLEKYAVVGCLHGPDRSKGAPVYVLEDGRVISTIMPKEDLGLQNFTHVHNAVLHKVGGKFYVIVQAWNPGDFAILEQVIE